MSDGYDRIDLDVVAVEVTAAIVVKHFKDSAPRKVQLYSPVEIIAGELFQGEFVIESEFGTKRMMLTGPIARSEGQLTRTLLAMINKRLET